MKDKRHKNGCKDFIMIYHRSTKQDPLEDRSSSGFMLIKAGEMQHIKSLRILSIIFIRAIAWWSMTQRLSRRVWSEARRKDDAHIEILLLKRRENDIWETLVKPGKRQSGNRN